MSKYFTLWRNEAVIFPREVIIEGQNEAINSDFKTALKIMKLQSDPEVTEIRKPKLMLSWFYPEPQKIKNLRAALDAMMVFMVPKKMAFSDPMRGIAQDDEKSGEGRQPKVCFEFDAEEIYVSFIQDYKIDLITTDYLHWYKFLMLFANLSKDCAFGRKFDLRTMDLKSFKGKEKAKLMKAQQDVQIPIRLSSTDLSIMEEVERKMNM